MLPLLLLVGCFLGRPGPRRGESKLGCGPLSPPPPPLFLLQQLLELLILPESLLLLLLLLLLLGLEIVFILDDESVDKIEDDSDDFR